MTARVALVLGGGGLKGFAHIGVLRALEEAGIKPALYAGTSIGALIASAGAAGMSTDTMADHARLLQRRDLFRLNHMGMLRERRRVSSIYDGEALRRLCEQNVSGGTFSDLSVPVLVNTFDIQSGKQIVWGLPGLRDVSVIDAVYASCALPGFFPPGRVGGRLCIDGGTVDNLPVQIAASAVDAVIAIDVGSTDLTHAEDVAEQGFGAIYMRAATAMMHALQLVPLTRWDGPPMLLVRPRIQDIGWLSFAHTDALIAEGYRSAREALTIWDDVLAARGGVFPRRRVRITVDRSLCIGCGLCVALAPETMELDATGLAFARADNVQWSPADGDFVHQCPTTAIATETVKTEAKKTEAKKTETKKTGTAAA
jgi:NTE family protein